MKKNIINKIEEIKDERKISESTIQKILERAISNLAIAVSFAILILTYDFAAAYIEKVMAIKLYNIISVGLIIFTIVIFEIGYKKDSGIYAITGLEMLTISLFSLFAPYIYYIFEDNKCIIGFLIAIAIYYVVKIFIIYNKEKNIFLKEKDDINLIIKKESQDELAQEFEAQRKAKPKTTAKKSNNKKAKKQTGSKVKKTTNSKTTTKKSTSNKSTAKTKKESTKKATPKSKQPTKKKESK